MKRPEQYLSSLVPILVSLCISPVPGSMGTLLRLGPRIAEASETGAADRLSIEISFEASQRDPTSGEWKALEHRDEQLLVRSRAPVLFRSSIEGADGLARGLFWDFDDPTNPAARDLIKRNPIHTFSEIGMHHVRLTVFGEEGTLGISEANLLVYESDRASPTIPRMLLAQAASSSQIELRWSAATDREGRIVEYEILRSGRALGSTRSRRYRDTGLSPEKTYRYSVVAIDEGGNRSEPSIETLISTLEEGAFHPIVETQAISSTQIDLAWSDLSGAISEGGYLIRRDGVEVARTSSSFFADDQLEAKRTYHYTMSALDKEGAASERSASLAVTTLSEGEVIPFALVVLPDTQIYAQHHPEIFSSQTRWIRQNKIERSIRFVLHEGDITNTSSPIEWERAVTSMALLDGLIPYALATGNHDFSSGRADRRDLKRFNHHFGAAAYESQSTSGEAFESGHLENMVHTFHAANRKWLILTLEYGPRDSVLDWANRMASQYRDHRVIVLTHAYLAPNGEPHGSSPVQGLTPEQQGIARESGGANSGLSIWNKFIRRHENIFMVLSGHLLGDGAAHRVATGDHGNHVYEIFANYQRLANGGNGYLRIMIFDVARGRIEVETYSPYLDSNLVTEDNAFTFEGVLFDGPKSSN